MVRKSDSDTQLHQRISSDFVRTGGVRESAQTGLQRDASLVRLVEVSVNVYYTLTESVVGFWITEKTERTEELQKLSIFILQKRQKGQKNYRKFSCRNHILLGLRIRVGFMNN